MPQNTTGQLPIWLERLRNISAEGSPNELMSQSLLYETFTNLARLLAQHTAKGSPNELMPQNTTGQLPIWLERLRNISAEGSPNELMSQSLLYETFTNLARLLAQHTAKGSPNELMPQKFSPHLQYQKTATISSSGLCCYAPTRGTALV